MALTEMSFTVWEESEEIMGSLARYLQESFIKSCPQDWTCAREVQVLDPPLAKLFGYAPKADVVLQRVDGTRKLWIEFEVSGADPVANHAKSATAHLLQPNGPDATQVPALNMTMDLDCSLGEEDPRFDGNRAWRHLRDHLGMSLHITADDPALSAHFQKWPSEMRDAVETTGEPGLGLCPASWFE